MFIEPNFILVPLGVRFVAVATDLRDGSRTTPLRKRQSGIIIVGVHRFVGGAAHMLNEHTNNGEKDQRRRDEEKNETKIRANYVKSFFNNSLRRFISFFCSSSNSSKLLLNKSSNFLSSSSSLLLLSFNFEAAAYSFA